MRLRNVVLGIALSLVGIFCVRRVPQLALPQPGVPAHRRTDGDYLPRIDSADCVARDRFFARSTNDGSHRSGEGHHRFARINGKCISCRVAAGKFTTSFARRFLSTAAHPVEDHGTFNIAQYRRPDRRFILGTVTRFQDQNRWTFELIAGDLLDVQRTARAFREVRSRVFFGNELRYHPVPPGHETALDEFRSLQVPLVTTDELFAGMRYQPVNPGESVGYLRFVRGTPDPARVRRTDIVVLDHAPIELPVCAGIITEELQAPLAHVALLAVNRGTPDMALRHAFEDAHLRGLENRLVRLRVGPQEYRVEPVTQEVAERAWASQRPAAPLEPPFSERSVGLPSLRELRRPDVETVGAKAAQLGELTRVHPPLRVPRGFAVPFAAYRNHLRRNGIDTFLQEQLARTDVQNDAEVRARVLTQVRERITNAVVDPMLVSQVRARITELFPGTRVRFRSSTNAEDLPGFNGAGLYRSVVVSATATEREVADALRAVWSSVWSFEAHEERNWFRVVSARVAMGVLVQESIDTDVVNGVAVTGNPFNQGRPAVFINAQTARDDGSAVTAARGDEVPEQVLYYTYADEYEFERLSRSSRTRGAPVLEREEIYQLSLTLRSIHRHFTGQEVGEGVPMDVEFLLVGPRRELVIVQARPIVLRYDQGRGWAQDPNGEE